MRILDLARHALHHAPLIILAVAAGVFLILVLLGR